MEERSLISSICSKTVALSGVRCLWPLSQPLNGDTRFGSKVQVHVLENSGLYRSPYSKAGL